MRVAFRRVLLASLAAAASVTSLSPNHAAATSRPMIVVGDGSEILVVTPEGTSPPRTVARASGASLVHSEFVGYPSWSPTGTMIAYAKTSGVAYASTSSQLRIADIASGRHRTIIDVPLAGMVQQVAWSPDGQRLAFVLFTPNWAVFLATWTLLGSRWDVYVVDADGTDLRPLAPLHPSADHSPVWSPDSKKLALTSDREGLDSVFTVPVDGVPVPTRVSPLGMAAHAASWSPDGKRIAFLAAQPVAGVLRPPQVWVAHADGSSPRQLSNVAYERPAWSPDGRLVTVVNAQGISVVNTTGTPVAKQLTTGYDAHAAWSPTGEVAFVRAPGGNRAPPCGLYVVRRGQPEQIVMRRCHLWHLAWSPAR